MLPPAQKKALESAHRRRGPKSKYRAKKVTIDGHTFDSKKEGRRYTDLKLLAASGNISNLRLQPRFALHAVDREMLWVRIGYYIADFEYIENGEKVIEDVKGMKTPVYRWKKKHFEVEYGINIRET